MIKDSLKTIALSLIVLSFVSVAFAWTEPASNPPAGNTSAPLLTEPTAPQTTTETLQVNGLRNVGGTILDGNVGIGTGAVSTSKLEVKSTVDEILKLTREGGTYSTIFRQGEDDTLVVNNNNKDALTIKDGNVGIGTIPSGVLDIVLPINPGDIYEKNSGTFECDAGDTPVAYKTTSNTCSYSRTTSCSPRSCTTGSHDWSPTNKTQETCKYTTGGSTWGCNYSNCAATPSVKCQKPKTLMKINNSLNDLLKIDNAYTFLSKLGIGTTAAPTGIFQVSNGDATFDGNVRIAATTAPSTNGLYFGGDATRLIEVNRASNGDGQPLLIRAGGAKVGNLGKNGGNLVFSSGTATGSGSSDIYFNTPIKAGFGVGSESFDTNDQNRMTIKGQSGYVGIGTVTPESALHIVGDLRVDGSITTTDGTLKGYWQLNINGTNYAIPLYYTVSDWVNKVSITSSQNLSDSWGTEQSKSWGADGIIDSIRVSGSSDDGGYCYAYWNTGHIEKYRHDGSSGVYNVDGLWYSAGAEGYSPCPADPPSFDNSGNVKICQGTSGSGGLGYGNGSAGPGLALPSGTAIYVKARHTDGPSSGNITCNMDIRYKK